jgi:uncharacterized membrane protein
MQRFSLILVAVLVIALLIPYLLGIAVSWLIEWAATLLGHGSYIALACVLPVMIGVPWLVYRLFDEFFTALIAIEHHDE